MDEWKILPFEKSIIRPISIRFLSFCDPIQRSNISALWSTTYLAYKTVPYRISYAPTNWYKIFYKRLQPLHYCSRRVSSLFLTLLNWHTLGFNHDFEEKNPKPYGITSLTFKPTGFTGRMGWVEVNYRSVVKCKTTGCSYSFHAPCG